MRFINLFDLGGSNAAWSAVESDDELSRPHPELGPGGGGCQRDESHVHLVETVQVSVRERGRSTRGRSHPLRHKPSQAEEVEGHLQGRRCK